MNRGIVILFFASCQLLSGQSDDPFHQVIEDSMTHEMLREPVTIFASAIQSPYAISSIGRADIQKLNEPTIEPLLNSTAGIWMQTGALNTNRISIRGVGYREPFATTGIKVYLDDIPLTNGVGESSIEDIHPFILSGIDVWRGPTSALWGSGLGGMIHLKSESPEQSFFSSRMQAGANRRFQTDQHLSLRYGAQGQWGSVFHHQYINDDGYRANNTYDKHSFTWMQHWTSKNGWSLRSFLHHIDLRAFIPSSITASAYTNTPSAPAPTWAAVRGHEDYTKWITGLNIAYTPAAGWVYRGSLFGTFFNSDEVRPFNVLDESNTTYGMRHRMTWPVMDRGHITLGMELFGEQYDFETFETLEGGYAGQRLTGDVETRSYWNGFLQSDWTLGPLWYVFGGINVAGGHLDNTSLNAGIDIDIFPTAGINFGRSGRVEISASVSRGYSALGLDDMLHSDGVFNPDIIPETGWNFELAIKRDNRERGFARVSAYWMHIQNTIISVSVAPDVFEKINGASSLQRGVELESTIRNASQTLVLDAQMTLSWNNFLKFDENGWDHAGNVLPGWPALRQFLRITASPSSKWSASLEGQTVSEVFLNDFNTVKSEAYVLIHSRLTYALIQKEKWDFSISAWAHNLFDTRYASMFQINAPGTDPRYYYPGKPRSFYVSLAMKHDL